MALTWNNTGVEPSAEKKSKGYAAGEKLPAGHVNYFLNQISKEINAANTIFSNIPTKIVFGVYTGDDAADRTIDLGFRPYAVIVSNKYGSFMGNSSGTGTYAGLMALDGYDASFVSSSSAMLGISIVSNGFKINKKTINDIGKPYYYIAFAPYKTT